MTGAIVVLGEAVIDLIEEGDGVFHAMPGGSPLNVAVAAARLGVPTCLAARFASDRFGRLLASHAREHGVELGLAVDVAGARTGLAVASLDERGAADYAFYLDAAPDWQWSANTLPAPPGDAVVVHTGSLVTTMGPGAAAVLEYCTALRAAGRVLVSYDANVRPAVATDRAQAVRSVDRFAAVAHVVKVSEEDLTWLWPDASPDEVAGRWLTAGTPCVVVTKGADGAELFTAGGVLRVPSVPVDVVDTVGAGDAFTAGFLSGLLGRAQLAATWEEICAQPPGAELASAAARAAATAALACTHAGGLGPSADEVDKLMRTRNDADR